MFWTYLFTSFFSFNLFHYTASEDTSIQIWLWIQIPFYSRKRLPPPTERRWGIVVPIFPCIHLCCTFQNPLHEIGEDFKIKWIKTQRRENSQNGSSTIYTGSMIKFNLKSKIKTFQAKAGWLSSILKYQIHSCLFHWDN